MKRILSSISSITVLILLLLLSGCSLQKVPDSDSVSQLEFATILPIQTLVVGNSNLTVEVAATDASRAQGLSDRASLPPDRGMIFVFDQAGKYSFWMNRMNFPLDFIWLRHSQVVEVTTDVPPPTAESPVPVTITPKQSVDAVIEVNAGWTAQQGVTVGQRVQGLTGLQP